MKTGCGPRLGRLLRLSCRTAVRFGHEGCLRVLHELNGDLLLRHSVLADEDQYWLKTNIDESFHGEMLANAAAENGREGCLRVLHELGGDAAASLAAAPDGTTPAHLAAMCGHEGCLCVCCTSWPPGRANGNRPAHLAAECGHKGPLRVLHELGGDARRPAWLVVAANADGLRSPPTLPLGAGTRAACACCTSWAATRGQLGGSKSRCSDARPPCPCRCHHRWR